MAPGTSLLREPFQQPGWRTGHLQGQIVIGDRRLSGVHDADVSVQSACLTTQAPAAAQAAQPTRLSLIRRLSQTPTQTAPWNCVASVSHLFPGYQLRIIRPLLST